jgi:hypothetical protein
MVPIWAGAGDCSEFVRLHITQEFLNQYQVQNAGGRIWAPAAELRAFNDAIIREIEAVAEFG